MHLRHFPLVAVLLLVFCSSRALADCSDPFANPDEVLALHLRTTSTNWAAFEQSQREGDDGGFGGPGCDAQYPYFEAEFRCGEVEPWLQLGFRRKRDRTETTFKLPLKLDINRLVDGQRWPEALGELGFRRLTLNSGQPDQAVTAEGFGGDGEQPGILSALLTEHLAWRLMRRELPESSASVYATLTLHFVDTGETRFQGLYILIEDIDRTRVRARYGVDTGAVYKQTDANCPEEAVFEDPPPNSTTAAFDDWIGLEPNDFPGSWEARTNQALELDGLLRQEALRELFANTEDTILGRMNNYFALDLHGRRRVYLPWDLDDVFRPEPQARPTDTPLVSSCTGNGDTCAPIPLGVNVRDNAELRPRYLETLCRLTNGVGDEDRVVSELVALDARIRPWIAEESAVLWTPRGQDPLDASTPGTYAAELERMKEWIPARVAAVRSMIEQEGVPCARGCTDGASVACEVFGTPSQRSCVDGAWATCEPAAGGEPVAGGEPAAGAEAKASAPENGCGCRLVGNRSPRGAYVLLVWALLCFGYRRRYTTR